MDPQYSISQLQHEISELKIRNQELMDKLQKYTNPPRNKKFYQLHKDEIIAKSKEYFKKTGYKPDKEKKKEYNRRYNEAKKLKKQQEQEKKIIS